jgi:hypothetical protein
MGWDYSVSVRPGVVSADQAGSGVALLPPFGSIGPITGSTEIRLLSLRSFSTASVTDPGTFTHRPFSLDLTVTDRDAHASGTLTFAGEFNGSVSENSANVLLTFKPSASDSLILSRNVYTAGPALYSPPGPPNSALGGSLSAWVSVQPVPEPSSLVLTAVGVPLLAASVALRRFRSQGEPRHPGCGDG